MEENEWNEIFRMMFPEVGFFSEDGRLVAEVHLHLGLCTSSSAIKTMVWEIGDGDFRKVLGLFEKMTGKLENFRKYLDGIHSEYRRLLEEKAERWKKKAEVAKTTEERAQVNLKESNCRQEVYECVQRIPGMTIEVIGDNGPYMVNAHIRHGDCSLSLLHFENREEDALLKAMEYVLTASRSIEAFENRWNGFCKMMSGMSQQYGKEENGDGR